MSDRKYRQPGYQDRSEPKNEHKMDGKQQPPRQNKDNTYGPRAIQMPNARTVTRCTQCGLVLKIVDQIGACPQCAFELHSCKQCMYFDPSAKFECREPIAERVQRKDQKNVCTFYTIKTAVERETTTSMPAIARRTTEPALGTRPSAASDARRAFEDLFKK